MTDDYTDDETDQPCAHGDYRSCVVDDCRPLRRGTIPGVIVSPRIVSCMWCGGDSAPDRGQCAPCDTLLGAMQAAPRAGVLAIILTWLETAHE